jgi:hypothetical protein
VIYAFILLVVAVIACIFALRIAINATGAAVGGVELASIVASVLLALQIQVHLCPLCACVVDVYASS